VLATELAVEDGQVELTEACRVGQDVDPSSIRRPLLRICGTSSTSTVVSRRRTGFGRRALTRCWPQRAKRACGGSLPRASPALGMPAWAGRSRPRRTHSTPRRCRRCARRMAAGARERARRQAAPPRSPLARPAGRRRSCAQIGQHHVPQDRLHGEIGEQPVERRLCCRLVHLLRVYRRNPPGDRTGRDRPYRRSQARST
jgi:hypothetical protein